MKKSSIGKRSLTINGHKTSVSLEDAFWAELLFLSSKEQITVSALVSRIASSNEERNLSSALRVHVLNCYRGLVAPLETIPRQPSSRVPPTRA